MFSITTKNSYFGCWIIENKDSSFIIVLTKNVKYT